MYDKILLPTDGSENSKRANKHALWIAEKSNAEIIVLYVVDAHFPNIEASLPFSALPAPNEEYYKVIREEGNRIIAEFKQELENGLCKGKHVNLKTKIKEGKPYFEILEFIEEENIDLVVMGASGRHGLDRFVLGSVAERVLRGSKKPVLIVH